MKYVPPVGGADNDPYVDGNPANGVEGSPVPAAAIEHTMREIVAVIAAAGLTPLGSNLSQLLSALRSIGVFQTAAQFDNTTKGSTTEFVQRALGNLSAIKYVTVPYTLIAGDAGKLIIASGTGAVTFPSGIFPAGSCVVVTAGSGTDNISLSSAVGSFAYGGSSKATILLANNESVTLCSQGGVGQPMVISGGLRSSDDFVSFASVNGYQRLPSGIVIQWGEVVTSGSADTSVTFPLAFSSAVFSIVATISSASVGYMTASNGGTVSGFNLGTYSSTSTRAPAATKWIAIGK